MKKEEIKKGEIVIYKTSKNEVELRVRFEGETVWLTQKQISLLFDIQRSAITKHLNNIFKSGELDENSVSSILEHTRRLVQAGLLNKKYQGREVAHSLSPYGRNFTKFITTFQHS
ncbi:hypothetical protein KKA27_04215 [Patescibacteria group bacterium]|nr:hypothetical protein [Patescibacteria group bacterium]